MTDKSLPNLFELTPLNEAYRADPHSLLDDLRARCPARRDDEAGTVVVTRYEDARAVVSDRTLWRDPAKASASALMRGQMQGQDPSLPRSEVTSILRLDDPDHSRIRAPLVQAFYARVGKIRPVLEIIVEETLDRIDSSKPFDLMAAYCVPIPVDAIASIIGVEKHRLVEFRQWSEGVIQSVTPFRTEAQAAETLRCREKLNEYFLQSILARRTDPRDDLISDLAQLQLKGVDVTDTELQLNLTLLLIGGNLTTTDLIGNAVRLLLLHPDELARLKADASRVNAVVEETLRYDPPTDMTGRIASHDVDLGCCSIKAKESITVCLRAANRDPDVFENPHVFEVGKKRAPHLAFGGGLHTCLGAPLARLEAQVALVRLFERFPGLKMVEPDAPEWRKVPFFRGLERFPVRA